MTKEERRAKMAQADQLIRLKATGTRMEFAKRLGMSVRNLHYLMDEMKELNAPIYYCSSRLCYCYEYEVELVFGFRKKQLDARKIMGGQGFFSNPFLGVQVFLHS